MLVLFIIVTYSFTPPGQTVFSTDYISISIDAQGKIASISKKSGGKNYHPTGATSALLSLYKDSALITPVQMTWMSGRKQMTLKYPNGSVATVAITPKGTYLRFELLSLSPRNGVEAIVWGPYATTINGSIGETICVVHDAEFAIGLQSLNINTIEGLPTGNDDAGGGSFIDPLPGQHLPDSLKDMIGKEVPVNVNLTGDMPEYLRMYRGSAAVKKSYGSELRLFSRDRRIARTVENGTGGQSNPQFVSAIDVDFAGSAIAMFGCPEPKVLDVIEKIELNEKLPHPVWQGEWIKRSKTSSEAYLMFEGKDLDKGLEYAKNCGFKLIHIGDLFESWGHFGLNTKRFPGGASDIMKTTDAAWNKDVALGVHTLTMFTGTNDRYVSPVPSDSLCKTGSSVITSDISENDSEILIEDPRYFKNLAGTHTVKIGKELVNYRAVSSTAPWRLLDCKRAQYRTQKSAHKSGTAIDKLVNNDYQGFYPDIHLQDAYATRMAAVCNETGLGLMDFDGYGGGSPTGQGTYGAAKFIDKWYKSLDKYVLTCGAGTFHYYWHIFSFMNWGEPWYNALRQSQVNYRIENQRYFERNYMPHMLGWFSFGVDYRPEDIEWIQARSAAFNAGYLLRVDEGIEKNGFKTALFGLINQWQKARNAGAFSREQLEKFKDAKNEFHLEAMGENSWKLFPVSLQSGFTHKFRRVQTGEPVATSFKMNNPFSEQPVRLYLSVNSMGDNTGGTVSSVVITINNYQSIEINETLKAGDRIFVDGEHAYLCDATWNKRKTLETGSLPKWSVGSNDIGVKSEFSGEDSPALHFDFKAMGTGEAVGRQQ